MICMKWGTYLFAHYAFITSVRDYDYLSSIDVAVMWWLGKLFKAC